MTHQFPYMTLISTISMCILIVSIDIHSIKHKMIRSQRMKERRKNNPLHFSQDLDFEYINFLYNLI